MLNQEILREAVTAYKRDFSAFQWADERYKWEAVKCFQNHWNPQAEDFAGMLKRALDQTHNLLASMNHYPREVLIGFANAAPDAVRAAFMELFDESRDLMERVSQFKAQADRLLAEHGNGARQHFQSENAISTYLWLRYPDKYYIYKYSEVRVVSKVLKSSYAFKKGFYADNLRNGLRFYDEICDYLKQDGELREMLESHLTRECYPDPALRILTTDVGFYISRYYYYSKQVETTTYLNEILEALRALGGKGHLDDICARMEARNRLPSIHSNPNWKQAVSNVIQTHCAETQSYKTGARNLFYSVEGLGRGVWGLRDGEMPPKREPDAFPPKLSEADWRALIRNPEVFQRDSLIIMRRMLDFGGEATCIQLSEKYGESWNYYNRGSSALAQRVARKVNCLPARREDSNACWWRILYIGRDANAEERGSFVWRLRDELKAALEREDLSVYPLYAASGEGETYDRAKFLQQVYMSGEKLDALCALLRYKKNVILQGAPGVGKTFAAKRLAYAMMGEKDESRVQLVQFHQSYAYEDFIMGYKPTANGFALKDGVFFEFCGRAAEDKEHEYFFLIDEINRGNMSKIFGESLMLIEKDYRNTAIQLPYPERKFVVPDNVYILGMMNTADRSLAMIDYALRRRFSFFEMEPAFDSEGFLAYQRGLENETFDSLISCIRALNQEIRRDAALGNGFCIGHGYFCNQTECTEDWMRAVVYYDILPMLREYWFDAPERVEHWEGRLSGVFE